MRQLIIASAFLLCALVPHANAQQTTLDIYWIDVEGGAATLIVTPDRQSVLMDAGFNQDDERDAQRIQAAMADAGITELLHRLPFPSRSCGRRASSSQASPHQAVHRSRRQRRAG